MATFQPDGARSRFLYAGRKPRINSYGNSFTECNQLSDGETWQEYLAGHFDEPIGNYGVGGYGVYQAYRRMLRQEATEHGTEYVILYIWGDDLIRSLICARWAATYPWHTLAAVRDKRLFHGNPLAHIEMDLSTGRFVEKDNPLSTPEPLYKMCDAGKPEYGQPGTILELDRKKVDRLAEALDCDFAWSSDAVRRRQAALKLLNAYGQRATHHILDEPKDFVRSRKKKMLIILNYTAGFFQSPSRSLRWHA
jgi:hypothetical protein